MKIQKYDRVRYEKNPLAEVICQVRFPLTPSFAEGIPDAIRAGLEALGYINPTEEQLFSISIAFASTADSAAPPRAPTSKIFHFGTADQTYRVSLCTDYVALTCLKYSSWDEFQPRFLAAYELVRDAVNSIFPVRVGLRYKDVIEREPLGLAGAPWSDLIAPFLLGPLIVAPLFDEELNVEESVFSFVTQATLRLEDCGLVLQSALLRSTAGDNTAFLIDSDFYTENADPETFRSDAKFVENLTRLHHNAGSLFRRGITRKLHAALGPSRV